MNAYPETAWSCARCGTVYRYEEEAEACCAGEKFHGNCSVPCPRCGDTADKARCQFCRGTGRVGDARCWWNGCDAAKKAS